MKRMLVLVLVFFSVTASSANQSPSVTDALAIFERIIEPTERAGGLYALETPKLRDFSPDVPITVDAECLRFAIIAGGRDKPMCRKHAHINKLLILKKSEGNTFGKLHPGDHEILVFYKGLGKLVVLDVSGQDIDAFVDAVRVLSPSLKKIKDRR